MPTISMFYGIIIRMFFNERMPPHFHINRGVKMMNWDVVEAEVMDHLTFKVRFADGLTGQVRLLPSHLYGVFEKLKDPEFFRQIQITDGFVSWPDEIDLAPDAMYEAIKRNGEWILV